VRPATKPDIFSPKVYAEGIPYDAYAHLRATEPVSWQEEPALKGVPEGRGFWALMRYDDVRHVSRTPELFSTALGCTQLRDPDPDELDFLRTMLINMDPPSHTALRRTVSVFGPAEVAKLKPVVETMAAELVARAVERGEFDLVEDVTDALTLNTLAHIIGVPESDRKLFFDWANRIIGYQDDEYADDESRQANPRSPEALRDMFEYADTLREYRRHHPGDDVISAMVHARIDGKPMSHAEYHNLFFLFAVAGNDTTRSALPGALLSLMEHPAAVELLLSRPEVLGTAVEECLRYAPPVILFRRTAVRDVTLSGTEIAAGDKVVLFYPAANRDPDHFADPDVFDITRSPNAHVSFGFGPHTCVAAAVGRLQVRAIMESFLPHLPRLESRGPVERLESHLVAGIKRVPVALA
jgi:cytochrome P450